MASLSSSTTTPNPGPFGTTRSKSGSEVARKAADGSAYRSHPCKGRAGDLSSGAPPRKVSVCRDLRIWRVGLTQETDGKRHQPGASPPALPLTGWQVARQPGSFPPTLSPVRGSAVGPAGVTAGHPGWMPAGLAAPYRPKTGPRGPHNPCGTVPALFSAGTHQERERYECSRSVRRTDRPVVARWGEEGRSPGSACAPE